jgi:alpha-beta hydrolase superfamily lysophospholipase
MGGLIVLTYLLDHSQSPVRAFAVSNPLIRTAFEPPRIKVAVGRLMSKVLPRLRLGTGLDPKGISRDPAVVQAYVDDPYLHALVSTRWFTSMTSAVERVEEEASTIDLPGLWILSGSDPIVDSKAGLSVARKTPRADIKEYPESFHEPHNDLDRDRVIGDLCTWMRARV